MIRQINGSYFNVDPVALASNVSEGSLPRSQVHTHTNSQYSQIPVLESNARSLIEIESPDLGKDADGKERSFLLTAVGGSQVGTVKVGVQEGDHVSQGQEMGRFAFGGSSIVVCFPKGRLEWHEDIRDWSKKGLMTHVVVNEAVGRVFRD
jgi:phosphatidylserine decarboxylase